MMALEIALRELETFGPARDPENYAVAIYGEPAGDRPWGCRIEGHHLSLHLTLQGDRYVATLPQFFGANPARVPRDFGGSLRAGQPRPRQGGGRRTRRCRHRCRRAAATAMFDTRPYGDIVSRNAARAQPPDAQGRRLRRSCPPPSRPSCCRSSAPWPSTCVPSWRKQRLERVRAGPGSRRSVSAGPAPPNPGSRTIFASRAPPS